MVRITILPQEKPLDVKEGKPGPEGEVWTSEILNLICLVSPHMVSTSMLGFISLSTNIAGILDCRLGKACFLLQKATEKLQLMFQSFKLRICFHFIFTLPGTKS